MQRSDGRDHGADRPSSALDPGGVHSAPPGLRPEPDDAPAEQPPSPWPSRLRVAVAVALPTLYAIGIAAALLAATGVIETGR